MAGHSKWANIKHRKAAQDAKRGKIFTKLIKELVVAAKQGGPNPEDNPTLRACIDKALRANMKKDTVDKAIARGAGGGEGDDYEDIRYEGYGPNGIALIVDCLTDNKNRSVMEVRNAFNKRGGNMGTSGSVAYMFKKQGTLSFPTSVDEDALMEVALDAGAEDIVAEENGVDVITAPEDYMDVKTALVDAGFEPESAEVSMEAEVKVPLELDDAQKALDLIDALEDLDDVQNVYSNIDVSDEVMAQLMDVN